MKSPDLSKLKNTSGTFRTKALFYEMTMADKSSVVFTLKPQDHLGYPSLKKLYLEARDPTEYVFANTVLGGWEHWQKLLECDWFVPYITIWREELELLLKAEAYKSIHNEASEIGSKNRFSASRYILEAYDRFTNGKRATKGRPTNDDIKRAAFDIAVSEHQLKDDLERITRPN